MTKPTWDKFVEAYAVRDGKVIELEKNCTLWRNKFYTVEKKILQPEIGEAGAIHLSIKSNDRKAIRDWRHFQRIKNELAGKEREGVEIFPPDSLLVDTANQYHIWILPESQTTPFTWREGRLVDDTPEGAKLVEEALAKMGAKPEHVANAVQRPHEND